MGSLSQLSVVKGQQFGDKTALIFHDEHGKEQLTSYNSLNSMSNRIAAALLDKIQSANLKANNDGDWIICVCMKPSNNLIITLLSIWKCGAAYLPLDVTFPENRIQHILNESKPVLIIYDDDFDRSSVFDSSFMSIKFNELKSESKQYCNANIDESMKLTRGKSDLGLVLYTSGSTGIPKGVRLPHNVIQNRLEWEWNRFPYSKTEVNGIFKSSLTFIDSVSEIWGPLLNGMTVVIVSKEVTTNPSSLIDILEKYKIERLMLVPTLLRSMLMFLSLEENNSKRLLYNLKIWMNSGEPLSLQLAKEFFNYFEEGTHVFCNFYGATEVMGDVTYFVCESRKQLDTIERAQVPIGEAVQNIIIYLLDSDLRPVRKGEIGELFVSGASLASGYVNRRDPHRFIENPFAVDPMYSKIYRTGDYASLHKGMIYYEGRTDSQIKIRGHRVDLSEIEKHLNSFEYVEKGVVLCYHAGEVDQAIVAFVITKSSNKYISITGIQIENDLKLKLVSYMVPHVVVLQNMPFLVNGKVDRQSLLKMYENISNNEDTDTEYEMDFSGINCDKESRMMKAKVLFETVASSIGRSIRSKLSVDANFYELGGNSLNSIFTVTQLRNKGYFISITDFITASNLGEIIDKLKTQNDDDDKEENENITNSSKCDLYVQCSLSLTCIPLGPEHKDNTIEMISTSFYKKSVFKKYMKDISKTDYTDFVESILKFLVEKDLSFIVKDSNGKSIAATLNFDAHDKPTKKVNFNLIVFDEFLEFIERPIIDNQLPKGKNKILHSFMMGTSADLNAKENVAVMHFMGNEVLKLAKRKNFVGIFATNTSPLTQQLCSNVYGYKTIFEYSLNKYVYHDNTKPFSKASDSEKAMVQWKEI